MQWASGFVMLVFAVCGCQSYYDDKAIHALLAEVSARLTPLRAVLGNAEVEDNKLVLLDGGLALTFRVPHGEDDVGRSFHVHALAAVRGRTTGGLDLCLVGVDARDVADALVQAALPPVVSAVRDEPLLGARHTWGDSRHGIDGHSAYLGDYRVRGDADAPLMSHFLDDGVFAGMPQLPHDDRMHLVKVVALAKDGELRRTIELDGPAKIENDKPVDLRSSGSGANLKAGSPSAVVVFAVVDGRPDPQPDEHLRAEALRRLAAHPIWLPDQAACAAKYLPRSFVPTVWDKGDTRGGRLLHAVRGCEAGSSDLCYAVAQELQSHDDPAAVSIFLRACQLGNASACTNAAAAREKQDDCAFKTYEASCDRGNDPWGCTMLGGALANGLEGHRELERARKALHKACALGGDDDPACQRAQDTLRALEAR